MRADLAILSRLRAIAVSSPLIRPRAGSRPPSTKGEGISLFTNITRKMRAVCYKPNTKKWDVLQFWHIPQIFGCLFGFLPKQLDVVVVGKGNGVETGSLQRAELLAQLFGLGQHGHIVVGA